MVDRAAAEAVRASEVLTRAVLRAADLLGVSQKELAAIVGVSAATLSRIASGQKKLAPASKEGELGLLFVRVFRSLDALLGGEAARCRAWLRAYNDHLQGVPLELLQSVRGLVHVGEYLDGMRGKI
ncbi:antitoxin Xre/MbcA/ParS toxin-binding domain-containing protein [Vulgatibacter sp.]|uniref:MbcA/ParS/Xre antitoxin family protein n=1 Tax=Vulgatibacter sp. TaxID=1971226 RepID=UPI0035655EE5